MSEVERLLHAASGMILPLSRLTRRIGGRQHHSISRLAFRHSKANVADTSVTIATLDGSEGDICFAVCAKARLVIHPWIPSPNFGVRCSVLFILRFAVPQVRQYTKIPNRVGERCPKADAYAFRREIRDFFTPRIRKS
jgi:hypothetical protein